MSEARVLEEQPVRERFDVDNDMKAEWCLSKIRKVREDQKREKEELQRQMQFYIDQMEEVDRYADNEVAFFESMLLPYLCNRISNGFAKEGKTQVSYKLPTGKLFIKKSHQEFEYKDNQDQTIKFLEDSKIDGFVKVTKTLAWSDFKKTLPKEENGDLKTIKTEEGVRLVTADGEIVPGIDVTMTKEEFNVEV